SLCPVLVGERPMPRPIPVPLRQAIWRRYQDGQDGPTIAQALGLVPRTVRHLLGRFRRGDPAPLGPSYDRCGAATPKPAESLVQLRTGQLVCWLRIVDECSGAVLGTAVFPPRPLDSGPAAGDPGATAAGLRSLGPARAVAGGQRGALGHAGRPADGPGVVVAR